MKPISLLLISTALTLSVSAAQATVLQGAPAHIQAQVDAIEAQGYVLKEWSVTLLGRYRIEFTNSTDNTEREVVLSSGDGTVLRDHIDDHDKNDDGVVDDDGHNGKGGHGEGHDGSDDATDDTDDSTDDTTHDHVDDHDLSDDTTDDSTEDHGRDHNDSNDDSTDDHGGGHDGSDDDSDSDDDKDGH